MTARTPLPVPPDPSRSAQLVDDDSGAFIDSVIFTTTSEFAQAKAEMRWHLDHGERVPRELCAGCRCPFMPGDDVLDLADDNRVHFDAEYRCLLGWGEQWRSAATSGNRMKFPGCDRQ